MNDEIYYRQKRLAKRKRARRVALIKLLIFNLILIIFVIGGISCAAKSCHKESILTTAKKSEKEEFIENRPIIIIDPGHGGKDVGTIADKIYEKDINLAIAKQVKKLLNDKKINVIMTRDSDNSLSLEERASIANKSNGNYFISIHCNFYEGDSSICGIEFYYHPHAVGGKSENLATSMSSAADEAKLFNRGLKTEDFHVLRETTLPAVLIETGYLSNKQDCKNLLNKKYQKKIAECIVEGILMELGESQ